MLACMLLVSQQLSFAHLLNHVMQSQSQSGIEQMAYQAGSDNLPPAQLLLHQSCQECLAFAHFGSALPTHTPDCRIFTAPDAVVYPTFPDFLSDASPSPFLSRAPPVKKFNLS
jgi:hypothetical protein